jgi:hypothetical protein
MWDAVWASLGAKGVIALTTVMSAYTALGTSLRPLRPPRGTMTPTQDGRIIDADVCSTLWGFDDFYTSVTVPVARS